jgi:hypothetical protein
MQYALFAFFILSCLTILKSILLTFISFFSVEVIHLGPLLSTIFVSLLPLLDDFTVQIGSIFSFLIIENSEILQQFFKELSHSAHGNGMNG